MVTQKSIAIAANTGFAELQARLIDYASCVQQLRSPDDVAQRIAHENYTELAAARSGRNPVSPEVWGLEVHQARKIRLPAQGCTSGLVGGV